MTTSKSALKSLEIWSLLILWAYCFLPAVRCGFACALSAKTLWEWKCSKFVGFDGPSVERAVPLFIASFADQNLPSISSLAQYKPPLKLPPQRPNLPFVGINARNTLDDYRNENLDTKVVQPHDMAAPGMMRAIKRVSPSFFMYYFSWEVDSIDCTPTSDLMENASYGHPCNADETGFDETNRTFRHCKDRYHLIKETKWSAIQKIYLCCDFIWRRVIDFLPAEKYFTSVEYNNTNSEYKDLIPTIKKYLEYYAFQDTMHSPPAPSEVS